MKEIWRNVWLFILIAVIVITCVPVWKNFFRPPKSIATSERKDADQIANAIAAVKSARLKMLNLSCDAECILHDRALSQKYMKISDDLGHIWMLLRDFQPNPGPDPSKPDDDDKVEDHKPREAF